MGLYLSPHRSTVTPGSLRPSRPCFQAGEMPPLKCTCPRPLHRMYCSSYCSSSEVRIALEQNSSVTMIARVLCVECCRLLVCDCCTHQEVLVHTDRACCFSCGDCVCIRYSGAMTMSIPPQITATCIDLHCPCGQKMYKQPPFPQANRQYTPAGLLSRRFQNI